MQEFISSIDRGEYVIPHFQRDFEWAPNMVSALFNSILQESYAGTVLLWHLGDPQREREMWEPLWGAKKSNRPIKAVLDGQQRLSSLYYALHAPAKKFPNRDSYYYFFIDLEQMILGNEEENIIYKFYKNPRDSNYFKNDKEKFIKKGLFPLSLLSDQEFLKDKKKGYANWIKEYVKSMDYLNTEDKPSDLEVSERIKSILSFSFLTETLEGKEDKDVCTIFANINSKGLRLDIFDLINAFLFPYDIELRIQWDKLENHNVLKSVDQEMKVYLLKLMSLHVQRYCSSKYLYNLIPGSTVKDKQGNKKMLIKNKNEFTELWENAIYYSEKAREKIMDSGLRDFGAIKPIFIPNTTLFPVLGALWLKFDSEFRKTVPENEFWKKINRWYWCAVLSGDYSGSSDSIMSQDYREIVEWLRDNNNVPERVKKINNVFVEESLGLEKARNTNNSRYCAVLNLLALESSRDWFTHRILGNYSLEKINDHHIFPTGCKIEKDPDLANSILNRTLLHEKTNQRIKNSSPKEYCKEIKKEIGDDKKIEEIMETHLISPAAFKCMQENDFKGFIRERKKTIISELKKVIGLTNKELDRTLIAPGKDYDNSINYIGHIEDAVEFIYILDPYYKENSLRLLRKGLINNSSVKTIRILTKPNTIDEDFKDSFGDFARQMSKEGIAIEFRVVVEPKIQGKIHNRYLITKNKSYDFVSADTIERGQLSHIKEVSDVKPIFDQFWEKGRELMNCWQEIKRAKDEKERNIKEMNQKGLSTP